MTGFYRNGRCDTGPEDRGTHVVCAEMTEAFLSFTKKQGNDLSTPHPAFDFPGLSPGDRWCLCAGRWKEAYEAGVAPPGDRALAVDRASAASPLSFINPEALPSRSFHRAGMGRLFAFCR